MAGVEGLDLGFLQLRNVNEPMALFQIGPGGLPPLGLSIRRTCRNDSNSLVAKTMCPRSDDAREVTGW